MQAIFYNGPLVETHIGDMVNEIYRHRIYEPVIAAAKYQLTNPDISLYEMTRELTIVDAGANIGITTAYFAGHAKRVISLEPCDDHRECLTAMVYENKLRNVEILPCALWSESGTATLHHADNPTAHSLINWNTGSKSSETTITMTLADLMTEHNIDTIDILKMDVEGAESEIIVSDGFMAIAPRIRFVIGEWHSWTKYSQETIRRALNDAGYRAAWLQLGTDKPNIFLAWRSGEREPNYGQVVR